MNALQRVMGMLAIVAMVAATLVTAGCQTTDPNAPPIDWAPFVRAVDESINAYVAVKFPDPTPEQGLAMSLKRIGIEVAILYMQRNGAPPALIAEQRAKVEAVDANPTPGEVESAAASVESQGL